MTGACRVGRCLCRVGAVAVEFAEILLLVGVGRVLGRKRRHDREAAAEFVAGIGGLAGGQQIEPGLAMPDREIALSQRLGRRL